MRLKEYPIGDYVGKCQTWNPKSSGVGSFDYIDLSSVDKSTKSIVSIERYECSDAPSRARQLVEADDVLVATVRPNLNGVALINGAHHGMTASTGYCVLRPDKDKLYSRFLFHWVKTGMFVQRMVDVATGANYPAVSAAKVKASKIPLPPLAEQKRVARILDAADALRTKRRESLAQLDDLLQSTFLDMFGDPVVNPMGWPPITLSEISEEFRDGPFGSNLKTSHYVEKGVRVIRLQNIGVGEMLNDDHAFISEEHFASLPRNHCKPGDVIIGTMGDPNLRACIVPAAVQRALNKADCILMRVDMSKVDANYVCWLLNNPGIVSMALRLVRGQTRGRISLGRLKNFQVHLPPIDLQHRFASLVEAVEQQRASQRAHLAELDTLFASLQSRAFRGDL